MRDAAPGKALFVVHREQIAKQALKSYQRVLGKYKPDGSPIRYGLLSGNEKDYDADYGRPGQSDFSFYPERQK